MPDREHRCRNPSIDIGVERCHKPGFVCGTLLDFAERCWIRHEIPSTNEGSEAGDGVPAAAARWRDKSVRHEQFADHFSLDIGGFSGGVVPGAGR